MPDLEDYLMPETAPDYPEESPILEVTPRKLTVAEQTADLLSEVKSGAPVNIDAERTILGAILLDNAALLEVQKGLTPSDFSLSSHRVIWARMVSLEAAGHAIDIVTLVNELDRHNETREIGGAAYLASLTEGLPRRPVIDEYIRIVADKSLLRQLIKISTDAIARAVNEEDTGAALIDATAATLAKAVADCRVRWHVIPDRDFLIGANRFMLGGSVEVEWRVDGLVQLGGNGVVVGDPGASKSLLCLDMLLHMVAGCSWLGKTIPKRVKCALVSREDHPNLTRQRARRLIEGLPENVYEALQEINLDDWMWINSRAQAETFSLEKEADVEEIIVNFKRRGVEFAVFDVFRRLWEGDENDNTQVAHVLSVLTRIQTECQCDLVLLHHLSKAEGGIFNRIRGASSIYGWREWAFGVSVENSDAAATERVRKIVFDTKADAASLPIYYQIRNSPQKVSIVLADPPAKSETSKTRSRRRTP